MFNQIVPVANPQGGRGATARHTVQIINLILWAGLSVSPCLWPGAEPAQASASERGAELRVQESISLEPGKPIDRELSGGQSHFYKITMTSGQYLHMVVGQRGIDVAVALSTPDGKKISESDSQHLIEGSETVSVIAEAPGAYLIEVRSPEKTAKAGRYEIKVEELRAATAEDKYRVAGELMFREAEQLQNGTLEAKRKSIEKYHEALELYRRASERNGEAQTLNNIGEVYWSLGEMQKALEKYNEALPIRRAVGYRSGEAETLTNIGTVYLSLGETQKALEKYNEVLPIWRAIGDRRGEATTLSGMGVVYRSLGDMRKALEKYNESLPIRRAVGDRSGEAITLNNIGAVYSYLRETQKALEKYNEALPIWRAIDDRSGEATTLSLMGVVYRLVGETQKALEKYNEALPIMRAVGHRSWEAEILNNIGSAYWSVGETQKALEKYNEALPIRRAIGDRRGEALLLNNIGTVYRFLGETQKALEKYNEALSLFQFVGGRDGEAEALMGIARVEQKRGNLSQARQAIEQAIGLIESLRTSTDNQATRASYFASCQGFFETYVDVLMQMNKQNPAEAFDALALAVSERARARSLLELLNEAHADLRQGVDSSLLERERSLQQRLAVRAAAQTRLLNRKHTPEQAEAFAKEIAAITSEYEEIQTQIRARSPRYAALTQPQPLGLTEIQQQVLDPDTLLLEEIEAAARRVRELLTAPQPLPGDTDTKYQARVKESEESYWTKAAELSRMLLGPIASQLGKKRLAIVADGALQYIPFAALPVPSPENDKGRNSGAEPQPLFVEHEIVSLPSASTLATLRRETAGRKPAEKSLAVLADPVFSDDDIRVTRDAGKTVAQVKTRSADPDEMDIGFLQMTRSGRETGVVGAESGFGRLMVDEAGKPQDGFLRLQDIYNLKLSAELVVLSACQTGLGKEIKGEGLVGLARGFMYAGAPRILASLWKVDDQATSEFMERFYQGMLGPEALSAAGALRQAQLSVWKQKQWREPYYWAAFVLQGEWK